MCVQCYPESRANLARIARSTYGRGHAVGFANSTAAAEERDDKHDRAEHDQQDGRGDDVVLIADLAQLLELHQRNGTDHDQRNAAELLESRGRKTCSISKSYWLS